MAQAAGTLYAYVAEKEALVELALRYAARFDLPDIRKPVKFSAARLKKTAARTLEERLDRPVLRRALDAPPSADSLGDVLAETYDLLQRKHKLIALLDRCSGEISMLNRLYAKGFRASFFCRFRSLYARARHLGSRPGDVDTAAAWRAGTEMLVWMAMRRPGDADPPACDEAEARTASIALARAGLATSPTV